MNVIARYKISISSVLGLPIGYICGTEDLSFCGVILGSFWWG